MQSGRKVRVVLDTNTIVSALLAKDGRPAEVLLKAFSGEILNHTSAEILTEIEDVMSRPKIAGRVSADEGRRLVRLLKVSSVQVTPKQRPNVILEDPADNMVLACAAEAGADYIISGDRHLLKLGKYGKTRIVNSADFLKKR